MSAAGHDPNAGSCWPRRQQVMLAIAVLVAIWLGILGGYGFSSAEQAPWRSEPDRQTGVRAGAPAVPPSSAAPSSGQPLPGPAAPQPRPEHSDAVPVVPVTGTGTFTVAAGTGDRIGTGGRLVRLRVAVEIVDAGSQVGAEEFAAAVEQTLADPRGWTAGGRWSFQRVAADASADLTVYLTTPVTTDERCGRYGLDTGGEVSCRGGDEVMINVKRWLLAVPWYADTVGDYRNMVINHEIGHFLGYGHAGCPGPDRLAPVMQTQTYGLVGCVRNPWPYPDGSTYVG